MKTIFIAGILIVLFLVICFIGYKMGTSDQKYERDTGRDFASHRDRDFGGGHYGGGYGGYDSGYGRPRTRSYDSDDNDPYDLSSPIDDSAEDTADEGGYEDYSADSEPRAPEF